MQKWLMLAAGILSLAGASALAEDPPAFAEIDLAGRFLFLDGHKPTPEAQLEGKSWTEEERQGILRGLNRVVEKAPGLVERATAYRPVRLYRAERIGRENAAAITITKDLSLFFGDIFFYGDADTQTESLAHEMVHLADPFMKLAGGKPWKDLVGPGIDRVQAQLRKKKEGLTVHQAMIEGQSDAAARDAYTAIVLKEGFPSLWSCLSLNEALAEYTMRMVLLDFSPPAKVEAFIRGNLLKTPFLPERAAQSLHEGLAAQEKGDLAGAIAAFDQAIAADGTQGDAYQFRAEAWEGKGDPDRAIADYGRAIALGASSETYFKRGQAYAKKGDSEHAIADFGEFIKAVPWLEKGWEARALEYMKKGELDKAIADYTEILRFNPSYLPAYGRRGDLWHEKKEYGKAIADFTEAIKLNPDSSVGFLRRGKARHANSDLDGAIADLSAVIRLEPNNGYAFYVRGLFYGEKSDFTNAKKDLEEALRLDPANKDTVAPWLKAAEEELSKSTRP